MTKARDLSNLANGVPNSLINLDSAEIPNLDASKITTGELANARVADLPASKITSGTFADARISQSSVSQHAQSFDDNKIINDLSTLALRQATAENAIAYNTSSSFIDVFQDASGIATITNASRNASEYVSSIIITPKYYYKPFVDYWTFTNSSTGVSSNNPMTFVGVIKSSNGTNWTTSGAQGGGMIALPTNSSPYYVTMNVGYGANNGKFGIHTPGLSDCNTTNAFDAPVNDWVWVVARTSSDWSSSNVELMYRARTAGSFTNQADSNGGTNNAGVSASGQGRLFRHNSGSYGDDSDQSHVAHLGWWNTRLTDAQLNSLFNNGKTFDWTQSNGDYSPTNLRDYFKFQEGSGTTLTNSGDGGNATKQSGSGSWDSDTSNLATTTVNSTGNFIGTTITAPSSVSSMGAIITYQDNAGTNALNTDIVLELSANNGSNFSVATLSALPNFSTGIKMAKVNDLAVTAGTQLKYRLSFANQSSGSKEARIRGISLQY